MSKTIIDKTEIEINNDGTFQTIAMKGRIVKPKDLDKEFLSHRFDPETLRIMFWSQFEIDYSGG
jgi:hypothetical protein